MRIFLLAALLLSNAAVAGEDIDHHLNQARLFMRKGWHEDAAAELRAALESPAGRTFAVYELAGQAAWELQDIDTAIAMAEGAAQSATTEAQRDGALRLAESYRQQFGFLTISGPHEGMSSRLQLECTSLILSAELKDFTNRLALRLKERTALPVRIGLPVGSYQVNGEEVAVSAGSEAALDLPMRSVGARGLAALQVTRLEVALGGSATFGEAAAALLPAPLTQISLTQPVGPVLLGGIAEVGSPRYIDAQNRIVTGSPTWTLGGRLGRELYLAGAISVRPSVVVRRSKLSGLTGADGHQQLSDAAAMALGGELSMEYREAGRTTALGTGVKLTADRTLGSQSDAEPYAVTTLRMLTNLSLAF